MCVYYFTGECMSQSHVLCTQSRCLMRFIMWRNSYKYNSTCLPVWLTFRK